MYVLPQGDLEISATNKTELSLNLAYGARTNEMKTPMEQSRLRSIQKSKDSIALLKPDNTF